MAKNRGFGQIVEEGSKPGFFKILQKEDLSSEFMRMIPHHLIRKMSEESLSFKMVLKVPWGNSWPIKISKNPNYLYMEETGWNKFVKDNGLGENEFLTFTHEANTCFNVRIYNQNGTEMIKPATIASSSNLNKREQRKNIYNNVKKEEIESSSESSPSLITGGRLKQKQKLNLRKKKVKTEAATTSSTVPEFNITIKKSYLLFLGIPKRFMEKHMPKETRNFKIHYPIGNKSWEVLYLVTDAQSRFSAGWSRLVKDLGLQVGNVCTFKLIKPTEMILKISHQESP